MKNYKARWADSPGTSRGNVSFMARTDEEAKRKADRIAGEINLPNTPRTIYEGGRCVEVLNRGKR